MSSSGEGGGGAFHPHHKQFFFTLLILFVAWFLFGRQNAKDTDKPFLHPANPIDSGTAYGPNNANQPVVHPW